MFGVAGVAPQRLSLVRAIYGKKSVSTIIPFFEIAIVADSKKRFRDSVTKTPTINYNAFVTLLGIPFEAYDYIVNGKSALE